MLRVASSVDPPLQRVMMKQSRFVVPAAIAAAGGWFVVVVCRSIVGAFVVLAVVITLSAMPVVALPAPSTGRFHRSIGGSSRCHISDYFRSQRAIAHTFKNPRCLRSDR